MVGKRHPETDCPSSSFAPGVFISTTAMLFVILFFTRKSVIFSPSSRKLTASDRCLLSNFNDRIAKCHDSR